MGAEERMKKSVLVVDDEEGYRQMYRFILEPLGVSVDSACDGQEAVQKIRERSYDLVLMDVHMPILTGPEALKEIKKIRPGQKVIIFSSSSDPESREETQALKEGAIQCFYKPVELAVLEKILYEID